MSFIITRPAEVRAPEAIVLPDGRKRLTRFFALAHVGVIPPELNLDWGTPDAFEDAPDGWEGLRLVGRRMDDELNRKGADTRPIFILVYEQIDETDETRVGEDIITHDEGGGFDVVREWVQFSSNAYVPQTVSSSTITVLAETAYHKKAESIDDGTVRRIKRTYTTAGIIATDEQIKNGGKLVIKTITSVKTVPSTPSGFTLIGKPTQNPDGLPIYTYTFAQGEGEISRDIDYGQSSDQGTTGITRTTIRHLTAASVNSDPTSAPSGQVKISEAMNEQDGYRVWTIVYAKGTGLVAEYIHSRQDGLREVTDIALGTKVTPTSGVVIRDDYEERDGYTLFTVTAIQSSDGFAPTSASLSFERYVPFLYPGRLKAYHKTASNGWEAYDVFESPPVSTQVKATVAVTYQTSESLGSIADYWNPKEWATIEAEWIGESNRPHFAILARPGYRSVDTTALTFTASTWADGIAGTMLGNVVYGGTTAIVQVYGGPADPGGDSLTLDATIEPAFTGVDGTVYYRKTLVTADIPAQDALPV